MIGAISLEELTPYGEGVTRPETVLVLGDRIFVSDGSDAAITEIQPDGSCYRMGYSPGETNGLSAIDDKTIVFSVFDRGQVSTIDLETQEVTVLADSVGGQPLSFPNFPLADPDGGVWVSCTTRQNDPLASIAHRAHDGYIVRIDPRLGAAIVADGVPFANCMVFGPDRLSLYVVRTTLSDVGLYRIRSDKTLAFEGRYGPALGGRRDDEIGEAYLHAPFDPRLAPRWALADGCGFDAMGNLWVTLMSANRVVAISPDGSVSTVVDDPEGRILQAPSSLAWGGPDHRDLYIGSIVSPYVVKTRSPTPGLPLWHNHVSLSSTTTPGEEK